MAYRYRYDDKKANYINVSRIYDQNKTSTLLWSIDDNILTDAGDGLGAEAGGAGGGGLGAEAGGAGGGAGWWSEGEEIQINHKPMKLL